MSTVQPGVSQQPDAAANGRENWWDFLQRARKELEAAGATFRRGSDIAAEIDQLRGEHERADAVYWEMEWQKHHPQS
ncbi:MAG TPA: hypothetical protein VNH11_09625 [Pirellulales bacterium]|nr:hypothetical protein [Pirellulales bacterium]